MPLADYPAERKVLTQSLPLLENVSDPGLEPRSRETMIAWNEKSCLTVPMRSADGPMGLLVFWDPERERHYTPDEMALAVGLAELAGEAVRRARLVRSLQRLSGTDSLTGLANHRQIHELLNREQARAERHGLCFNLVMLDIDGFKLLNDTYGHPCGDTALRHIAAILQANARASDVVGRYAGDEFVLILSETGAEEAYIVVEKMRAAIAEKPFVTPTGEKIPMHASFGIATFPDDGQGVNELVVAADSNLYVSKRRGGNAITGAGHVDPSEGEEKTSFGILESMVTAVDNKDRYTRRHSEQVTELALVLGNALGLSESTLRILRAGGLLHDVGKIGIPDRILRKPGPLTPEEWAIVKGHPSMGETLIRTMPDLSDIQALVASHHEYFDGTGYPRGLSGRDIPLLARILTVADSFSAMITDRPYRKALSRRDAVFELRKGAGTHFDPAIVSTFIQCIEGPFEGRLDSPFEAPSKAPSKIPLRREPSAPPNLRSRRWALCALPVALGHDLIEELEQVVADHDERRAAAELDTYAGRFEHFLPGRASGHGVARVVRQAGNTSGGDRGSHGHELLVLECYRPFLVDALQHLVEAVIQHRSFLLQAKAVLGPRVQQIADCAHLASPWSTADLVPSYQEGGTASNGEWSGRSKTGRPPVRAAAPHAVLATTVEPRAAPPRKQRRGSIST